MPTPHKPTSPSPGSPGASAPWLPQTNVGPGSLSGLAYAEEICRKPEDFKVLRKVPAFSNLTLVPTRPDDEVPILFLDLETTGTSAQQHHIIEIGLLSATYSPSLQSLTWLGEAQSFFHDPGCPIPEKITQITGITTTMVRTGSTNHDTLTKTVQEAVVQDPLVIAHNAAFDRAFFENLFTDLCNLRWGCSVSNVPWQDLGAESRKLKYLLIDAGWFFKGHRAADDCRALAWLMYQKQSAMASLWQGAQANTFIIQAWKAPFAVKDQLKRRGYRWCADDRVWWMEADDATRQKEATFLTTLYDKDGENVAYLPVDARTRFRPHNKKGAVTRSS